MVKVLHFADAHIDIASHGRHDAATGLPVRVLDFLKALDTIVDAAIAEKVDLVIFAGDAYKDRMPTPTFQREWGRRIMRLSTAKIPTLLLVGNHDVSPASGRAHTLQEFDTLEVPFVRVLYKPELLNPEDLWGLPLQVITFPWIFRSNISAALDLPVSNSQKVNEVLSNNLTELFNTWMDSTDPNLPTIFIAHGTLQGAKFGSERSVMLGSDFKIPPMLVKDKRLDYVALGHLHSFQNLNPDNHPPVIYSGSIERIDFGEAKDKKYFVVAKVEKSNTTFEKRKLNGRQFIPIKVTVSANDNMMEKIIGRLPSSDLLRNSMLRLVIEYPRDMETFLDEVALRERCASAFEFHLVRRPLDEARTRFSIDESIANYTPLQLLKRYWGMVKLKPGDTEPLQALASSIIQKVSGDFDPSGDNEGLV